MTYNQESGRKIKVDKETGTLSLVHREKPYNISLSHSYTRILTNKIEYNKEPLRGEYWIDRKSSRRNFFSETGWEAPVGFFLYVRDEFIIIFHLKV